jgi:hypothetical protein
MYEYENTRRIQYGEHGPVFVPVCPKCGRFVKADENMQFNIEDQYKPGPNASCKKCGRVEMPCEGYF